MAKDKINTIGVSHNINNVAVLYRFQPQLIKTITLFRFVI